MKAAGQILLILAVVLMVGLFVLALAVDGGRLYLERARMSRSAQAAADAGSSWVAEQMVTQVVPHQTQAAGLPPCLVFGEFGDPAASCTATPAVDAIPRWLTDSDRATLTASGAQATVEAVALQYAELNDLRVEDPSVVELRVEYPHEYDPQGESIQVWVGVVRRTKILLVGLLGEDFAEVRAETISRIPQR